MNLSTYLRNPAVKKKIRDLLYSYRFPRDIIFSYLHFGKWDSSWRLFGTPLIFKKRGATLKIGSNWTACSDPKFNSLGVFQKVTIKLVMPNSILEIGDNVGMSGVSISCSKKITIGNNTLLGSGAVITDSDAHAIHFAVRNNPEFIKVSPVTIGNDVFIGARAIILKGVTIGDGAVIGAGAVVSRNVSSMAIMAGNPAREIGSVSDPKFAPKGFLQTL